MFTYSCMGNNEAFMYIVTVFQFLSWKSSFVYSEDLYVCSIFLCYFFLTDCKYNIMNTQNGIIDSIIRLHLMVNFLLAFTSIAKLISLDNIIHQLLAQDSTIGICHVRTYTYFYWHMHDFEHAYVHMYTHFSLKFFKYFKICQVFITLYTA